MLTVVGHRPAIGPFELHEHLEEAMRLPGGGHRSSNRSYRAGSLEIHIPKRNGGHRVIPIEPEGGLLHQDATPC
jgi:hypothetical protein